MTKTEVIGLLKRIRVAYPYFGKDSDDLDIINVWSGVLHDADFEFASSILDEHIKKNKFPPSPSDLMCTAKKTFTMEEVELNTALAIEQIWKTADACGIPEVRTHTYFDKNGNLLDHMIPDPKKDYYQKILDQHYAKQKEKESA